MRLSHTMRKLCQVVGLVIIRHVTSTSSPAVVGSCEWLIGGVHSQFVVLPSQCEALCCISTSSKTLTVNVSVYTAARSRGFLIYWGKLCVSKQRVYVCFLEVQLSVNVCF